MSLLNATERNVIALQNEADSVCDDITFEMSEGLAYNQCESWTLLTEYIEQLNGLVDVETDQVTYFTDYLVCQTQELTFKFYERQAV